MKKENNPSRPSFIHKATATKLSANALLTAGETLFDVVALEILPEEVEVGIPKLEGDKDYGVLLSG